jgi:SPP1 gp7 family putative phage head morphogenesis protein
VSALSEIEAAHARHRAGLLAAESAEQRALVASYAKAIREVEGRLAALAVEIASATANLDPADAAAALRGKRVAQARLEGVLDDLRYEVARWTDSITPSIEALHADAVNRGIAAAESLTRIGLGPPPPGSEEMIGRAFASVDHGAVENAVAFSHGGPVRELLTGLAGSAAEEVAQEMAGAVARGQNPLVTASRIRSKIATPLYRAQTITRTETLRAYREATREAYQQSGLVKSWVWVAACDGRTCGACWALHGTEFPTAEKMGTHPRCRCTMAPNTRSWEELTGLRQPGVQETNLAANITKGPDLFDALPDSTKLEILGPSKFAAYKDGAIKLEDLVHVEDNAVWGTTRREASLRSILGDDAKGYYPKPKPPPPSTPPKPKPPSTPPSTGGIDDGIGGVITEADLDEIRKTFDELGAPWDRDKAIELLRSRRAAQSETDRLARSAFAEGRPALSVSATSSVQADELALAERSTRSAFAELREEFPGLERNNALPGQLEFRHIPGRGVRANYTPALNRMQVDSRYPTTTRLDYVHEFGHFLDYRRGGGIAAELGTPSAARDALLSVLRDTNSYRSLKAFRRTLTGPGNASGRKYLDYLLSDEEMIARAFQQYVAHKRGGELLIEHLRDVRGYGTRFQAFPDDEIERVAKAFDDWIEAILP